MAKRKIEVDDDVRLELSCALLPILMQHHTTWKPDYASDMADKFAFVHLECEMRRRDERAAERKSKESTKKGDE